MSSKYVIERVRSIIVQEPNLSTFPDKRKDSTFPSVQRPKEPYHERDLCIRTSVKRLFDRSAPGLSSSSLRAVGCSTEEEHKPPNHEVVGSNAVFSLLSVLLLICVP